VLLYLSLGISLSLIISCLLRYKTNLYIKTSLLFILLVLYERHITHVSYNVASIMAGISSLLAFLAYLRNDKKKYLIIILLGVHFSFSYMFRIHAFQAAFIFSAPILLHNAWVNRKAYYKYYLAFFIPLLIVLSLNVLVHQYSETPQDKEYQEWNKLREDFQGHLTQKLNWGNKRILSANSWTDNDYGMMAGWLYLDENKFNIKSITNVFKYSAPLLSPDRITLKMVKNKIFKRLVNSYPLYCFMLVIALILPGILLNRKQLLHTFLYLIYCLAGIAALTIFYRFPPRIAMPILLMIIIWGFYVGHCHNWKKINTGTPRRILFVIIAMLCVIQGIIHIRKINELNQMNYIEQAEFHRSLDLLEKNKADYYLIHPDYFRISLNDPLRVYHSGYNSIPLGWAIYSPRFYKILTKHGMEHAYEVYPNLVNNKKAFWVGDKKIRKRILTYLYETHGMECKAKKVFSFNKNADVFAITTKIKNTI